MIHCDALSVKNLFCAGNLALGGIEENSTWLLLRTVAYSQPNWLVLGLEFTAASGGFVVRIGEAHGKGDRFIRERCGSSKSILDLHHDFVLIFTKADHITSLIHDYKQNDLPVASSSLPHQ